MSDAAAFFSKKKKKKTFKFNANLIDATTVAQTVHVDAPALSTEADTFGVGAALAATTLNENGEPVSSSSATAAGSSVTPAGGEWDDEALAASYVRKGNPASSSAPVAEVLDMKAFDAKRGDQDDIAERMRVEETRAQLAAAREGMEREAQRLKEESEFKEVKKTVAKAPSATGMGGAGALGSKWVPPHMRGGGAAAGGLLQRTRMAGTGAASSFQKLDTQNEELFPDLAAAESILEKQKEQVAYKVPKKTAVGGGATWGSRPPVVRPTPVLEPAPTPEPESAPVPEPAPAPAAPIPSEPAAALKKKVPTKKKKKDLSTFKPQN